MNKKRIRAHRIEKGLLIITILVVGFCAAFMIITASEPPIRDAVNTSSPSATQPTPTPTPLPQAMATNFSQGSFIDTGYLALVNHQHATSAQPSLTAAWPTVAVSQAAGMYLHPSALRAVSEMFVSAHEAGKNGLFVTSGFRGVERQAELYNGGANSDFVMPPGHSEHHTGLAVDILAVGVGMFELADSPQGQWMAQNSYRYGLILRYPEGAEHITGISFEPWHFRYVGKVHAYIMHRYGLVLEEYIELIKTQGISIEKNGRNYNILFQPGQNDTINLPAEMDFKVSSTNTGGYIVKAW